MDAEAQVEVEDVGAVFDEKIFVAVGAVNGGECAGATSGNRSLWSRLSIGTLSFRAVTNGAGLGGHGRPTKHSIFAPRVFGQRRPRA